MKKFLSALFLIALSIIFRTVWHLGPNIEFITTATLLASLYLGYRYAIVVPFISIVISDLFIGNTSIYLFTWSAFLIIALASIFSSSLVKSPYAKSFLSVVFGVSSGTFFYIWTNFGVWFLDTWHMYPNTFSGLIQAYIMGLPFLRYTLLGNIAFSFISVVCIEYVYPFLKNRLFTVSHRFAH